MNNRIVILKIEDRGDRVLLHPAEDAMVKRDLGFVEIGSDAREFGGFYVSASHEQAKDLKEGDTIEYDVFAVNVGLFVKKVET